MGMPSDIRIIDTMIGFPSADREEVYKFSAPALRDAESKDQFEFPAQYMFKDVPDDIEEGRRPGRGDSRQDGPLRRRAGLISVGTTAVTSTRRGAQGAPRPLLRRRRRRPERQGMEAVRKIAAATRSSASRRSRASRRAVPQVPINDKKILPDLREVRRARHPDLRLTPACPARAFRCGPQKVELLDEVCWFFPELTIVMRHGAEPWTRARGEADAEVARACTTRQRVRPEVLPEGHHRLRQHPRRRQDHLRAATSRRASTYRADLDRNAERAVQGRGLAKVPAGERREDLRPRRLTRCPARTGQRMAGPDAGLDIVRSTQIDALLSSLRPFRSKEARWACQGFRTTVEWRLIHRRALDPGPLGYRPWRYSSP